MTGTPTREAAIDIARGVAIIAIVLGHVDRGLASASILDAHSALFAWSDRFLYSWHLAVFALLSGLFLRPTRDRGTLGTFMRSRVLEWAYLYLVWSLLQGSVHLVTSDATNSEFVPADLLRLWRPDGQLWFLPWLMIASTLGALVRPWASARRAALALGMTTVIALAAWGYTGPVVGTQGLALLACYAAGAIVGPQRASAWIRAIPKSLGWLGGAFGVLACLTLTALPVPTPTDGRTADLTLIPVGVAASLSGVLGVILLSAALANTRAGWMLAEVGKRSLEVFLAHILATAGGRIVLQRLGIDDPAVQLCTGLILGITGPLILAWCLRAAHFPWLFRLPKPRRSQQPGRVVSPG